jgi:hypothetical protein
VPARMPAKHTRAGRTVPKAEMPTLSTRQSTEVESDLAELERFLQAGSWREADILTVRRGNEPDRRTQTQIPSVR